MIFNADKLVELRIKEKLSTHGLAEKVGTSQQIISAIENRIRLPNANLLGSIADFFGVSVDEFFETRTPPPSQNAVGE